MKVLGKEQFVLQNGSVFVFLQVQGCRGDRVSLESEGLSGKVVFYCESPKTAFNCVNHLESQEIELGGSEMESARTLYLIVERGSEDGRNEGERTASSVRS